MKDWRSQQNVCTHTSCCRPPPTTINLQNNKNRHSAQRNGVSFTWCGQHKQYVTDTPGQHTSTNNTHTHTHHHHHHHPQRRTGAVLCVNVINSAELCWAGLISQCVMAMGLYHDGHKPWWPQQWKREKNNSIILRNCQIHDIVGQVIFVRYGLWPSWFVAVPVEADGNDHCNRRPCLTRSTTVSSLCRLTATHKLLVTSYICFCESDDNQTI